MNFAFFYAEKFFSFLESRRVISGCLKTARERKANNLETDWRQSEHRKKHDEGEWGKIKNCSCLLKLISHKKEFFLLKMNISSA